MDFLWHKVSEKEKEDIRRQAKEIMDSFEKALKKVGTENVDLGVSRKKMLREEDKAECDEGFRPRFFDNAPRKDSDFIKAEKGAWR